jgi:hypothetical protein
MPDRHQFLSTDGTQLWCKGGVNQTVPMLSCSYLNCVWHRAELSPCLGTTHLREQLPSPSLGAVVYGIPSELMFQAGMMGRKAWQRAHHERAAACIRSECMCATVPSRSVCKIVPQFCKALALCCMILYAGQAASGLAMHINCRLSSPLSSQ